MSLVDKLRDRARTGVVSALSIGTLLFSGCQTPQGQYIQGVGYLSPSQPLPHQVPPYSQPSPVQQYQSYRVPIQSKYDGSADASIAGFGFKALGLAWGSPGLSFIGHTIEKMSNGGAPSSNLQIQGMRQPNGDLVYAIPRDVHTQSVFKNSIARNIPREKIPLMQDGSMPDITHLIEHPDHSANVIYAKQEYQWRANGERTETIPAPPKKKDSGVNLRMTETDKQLFAQDIGALPQEKTALINGIDLNSDGFLEYGKEVRFRDCREFYANSNIHVMMDTHHYGGRKIKKTLYNSQRNLEVMIGSEEWEFVENSPAEGTRNFVGKIGVAQLKKIITEEGKTAIDGTCPFIFRVYREGQEEPCEKEEITIHFNSLATSP